MECSEGVHRTDGWFGSARSTERLTRRSPEHVAEHLPGPVPELVPGQRADGVEVALDLDGLPSRHLDWPDCRNARDLGGLPTSDGRGSGTAR